MLQGKQCFLWMIVVMLAAQKINCFPQVTDRRMQHTGFGKPVDNCPLAKNQGFSTLFPNRTLSISPITAAVLIFTQLVTVGRV